ncbi:MAG: hypothetical protein JJ891_10455 [Rhizobiaceae bacterium]|nr:hypothetical protein [Rhizobiaceae bacterium]
MQRLDLKTLRYDSLGRSVLIDGRAVTVEISHEALETLANRPLSRDEAMFKVAEERLRLTRLAQWIPADDGKIHITTNMLMNNGLFASGEAENAD